MYGLRAKTLFGLLASAGFGFAATQGDTQCSDIMCVSANVNSNSTVTYVLQSTGTAGLGWMAIGFGTKMFNSPMVIMWPNDDMSITLSQRKAPAEVMPTLDSSPARVAWLAAEDSNQWDCTNPKLAFTVPANSDTTQTLIWAFSNTTVSDSSTNATIPGHIAMGTYTLNLQNSNGLLNPVDMMTGSPTSSASDSASTPSQTGAATSLQSMGKNLLLGGVLSVAAFAPFF